MLPPAPSRQRLSKRRPEGRRHCACTTGPAAERRPLEAADAVRQHERLDAHVVRAVSLAEVLRRVAAALVEEDLVAARVEVCVPATNDAPVAALRGVDAPGDVLWAEGEGARH